MQGRVGKIFNISGFKNMIYYWECHSRISGPCYDVLHLSKYVPSFKEADLLRSMTYPILNVEHENKFQDLETKIFDLKKLEGPVYSIERKHHFQEIDKKIDQLRQMSYPIREGVDPHHLYGELETHINEVKSLGQAFQEFPFYK